MKFSRRSTYSQRASCMTRCLFTDGMARKSKVSRLLVAGKRAALILPVHHAVMAVYQLKL